MYRSSSRSKWKDVLGFDDGYYSAETSPTPGSPTYTTFSSREVYSPPSIHSRPSYPRLPRDVTIYSTKTLDLLLRPSGPAPSQYDDDKPLPLGPALFYITIQKDRDSNTSTARPDIILHSGPSKASTIISFAKYHTVTQVVDMTLCPPPPKPITASFSSTTNFSFPNPRPIWPEKELQKPHFRNERLLPSGGIFTSGKHAFMHTLPDSSTRERFEWKHTNSYMVRAIEGSKDGGGLKLVRSSTSEVLAVWAGFETVSWRIEEGFEMGSPGGGGGDGQIVGMFRFIGKAIAGLGGEFEVLALMSVLSIVERGRRARRDPLALTG